MIVERFNKKLFVFISSILLVACIVFSLVFSSISMRASADSDTGVNYYTVSIANYNKGNFEYTFGGSRVILADGTAEDIGNPYTEYNLSGYYFAGWYTDEALTTPYDFTTSATPGLILYGGLKETTGIDFSNDFNINLSAGSQTEVNGFTIYANDGTAKKSSSYLEIKKAGSIAFSFTKEKNVTVTFENGGSREFEFGIDAVIDNKYTSENYNKYTQVLKTAKVGKDSVTLYGLQPGRYKFSYTGTSTWRVLSVTFSEPEYKKVNFIDYKRPAIPEQSVVVGDVAKAPEEYAVKGHTFLGWYTSNDEVYNFDTPITNDLTLTAKYQVNTYTVTFAEQGYDPISGLFGGALEEPQTPKKDGYTFVGWYQDEELTKPFNFKTDTLQGNMTLYAAFAEETEKEPNWLDSTFESVGLPGLTTAVQVLILAVVVIVIVKVLKK